MKNHGAIVALMVCGLTQIASIAAEPPGLDYDISGASGGSAQKFGKWYQSFKVALQKNDKPALAKMVSNELRVFPGSDFDEYTGKQNRQKGRSYTRKSFLKNYDQIMTPSLRHRLIDAWKSEFWDRDQGICLSHGDVWFDPQNNGNNYVIKTINSIFPIDIETELAKIKLEETQTPTNSLKLANLYSGLAQAYSDRIRSYSRQRQAVEKPALAKREEECFNKAISLRTACGKYKTAEQAKDLRLLADFLNECDRSSEAEETYNKALALQREVLPPQAPALAYTISKISEFYTNYPVKRKALLNEDLPRRLLCIQIKEKALKSKSSNEKTKELATDFYDLSTTYLDLGRKTEASLAIGKAYSLVCHIHPIDQNLASDIAPRLAALGKTREALLLFEKITDIGTSSSTARTLANALAKSGKYKEAESIMTPRIDEIKQNSYGVGLPEFVEVYIIEKKLDKALELADLAIQKCRGSACHHHALQSKGHVESALGHFEKAEKLYKEAFEEFTSSYPNDPEPSDLLEELVKIYIKEGKFADADKTNDRLMIQLKPQHDSIIYTNALLEKSFILAGLNSRNAKDTFEKALAQKTKLEGLDAKAIEKLKSEFSAALSKKPAK